MASTKLRHNAVWFPISCDSEFLPSPSWSLLSSRLHDQRYKLADSERRPATSAKHLWRGSSLPNIAPHVRSCIHGFCPSWTATDDWPRDDGRTASSYPGLSCKRAATVRQATPNADVLLLFSNIFYPAIRLLILFRAFANPAKPN